MRPIPTIILGLCVLILLSLSLDRVTAESRLLARQQFDRTNLFRILSPDTYQNDLLVDTFLLSPSQGSQGEESLFINQHLLGLQRDRLAYQGKRQGRVEAVILPVTIDDGFNGTIDLLLGIDSFGYIEAARVIADAQDNKLFGNVEVIDSRWLASFSGSTMRDLRRPAWQAIPYDDGYDQFVGASITPKAVAAGMYDALVFFQSNRIQLMAGDPPPSS
ncbi:MAG: hypothetical protein RQ757_05355 [Pseudomonadales bacterium]|nr:hypothetical protein [Pseudomonadales bacterium]